MIAKQGPAVKRVECTSVDQLLDQLSPRAPHFYDFGPFAFVFRGHADARFTLRPSAFRLGTQIVTPRGWRPVQEWTNGEQVAAERQTIRAFFDQADRAGLPLPEDSQAIRRHLFEDEISSAEWPTPPLFSLIGLAQHFGMPTRLLDWSRSSYKAAYFAAQEAARWCWHPSRSPEGVTHLGIWAYCLLAHRFDLDLGDSATSDRHIIAITAPAAGNPNLHAQEGVFTLHRPLTAGPNELTDTRPIDELIRERSTVQLLLHFTLPIQQAPTLLRLLAKEGVSGASLFPGFGGAALAVREQRYWRTNNA